MSSTNDLNNAEPATNNSFFENANPIGQKVANRWEIVAILGNGNMSSVYKAREISTGKTVALKLLHKNITASIANPKRIKRRAACLMALKHVHVSNFFDIYISPSNDCMLIYDYWTAKHLQEILSQSGHISIEQAISLFKQAADGIDYAHRRKILHLDIKPSNIYLAYDQSIVGLVKVVDFGIVSLIAEESDEIKSNQYLTRAREMFSSVLYMSPEQCAGQRVDARADIYALGCVMYEAVAGKPPFVGKNIMETAYKHMHEVPEPLNLSEASNLESERYQAVVSKALSKNPKDRYQSMAALRSDLEILPTASDTVWQAKAFAANRSPGSTTKIQSNESTPWWFTAFGICICLVLVILAFWVLSWSHKPKPKPNAPLAVHFNNNLLWATTLGKKYYTPSTNLLAQQRTMCQQLSRVEQTKTKFSQEYEDQLYRLCTMYLSGGQWNDATRSLNELTNIQKKVGGSINLAEVYADLATCYFWQNDQDNAETMALNALKIAKRTNGKELAAEDAALAILGNLYTVDSKHTEAQQTYLQLYNFWDKLAQRYPGHFAKASAMLADAYRRGGNLPQAEFYYRQALDKWQNYVNRKDLFITKTFYGLGLVLEGEGHYSEAQERFSQALPLAINLTGARGSFVAEITRQHTNCLFHTNFWQWLNVRFNPGDSLRSPNQP